jgi:phosphoglycolate phosphatase
MPGTILFDLDGTLVDSAPDIATALNRVLASAELAPFSLPEVTAMIGDGARVLVERALAARARPFDAALLDAFIASEEVHEARSTRPFDGVPEVLEALASAGFRLAVCTNKPEAPARSLLASLGLGRFFAAVGGGDSFPVRKPDPGHLLGTLRLAGEADGRAVMIGDHHNDMAAARGAGVPAIFAGWGYGPAAMAAGAPVAARPADLPALVRELA